jgi:hypothetical protein
MRRRRFRGRRVARKTFSRGRRGRSRGRSFRRRGSAGRLRIGHRM